MSPIVRRDDDFYKAGHQKRTQALRDAVAKIGSDPGYMAAESTLSQLVKLPSRNALRDTDGLDRHGTDTEMLDSNASISTESFDHSDTEKPPPFDRSLRRDSLREWYKLHQASRETPSRNSTTSFELTDSHDAPPTSPPPPPIQVTIRSAITLLVQSTPSLIVSLIGLIFMGQLLDHLAVWTVFVKCDELFIAVPALQNLKGNLEMCLGARLGTASTQGRLNTPAKRRDIITRALLFLQYQALSISALAGCLSFCFGYIMKHRIASPEALPGHEGISEGYTKPGIKQLLLVLSAGMLTASLSSAVLGNFITWLVVACRWWGVDPDNICSPLAACLGDFLTLFILALVGSALVAFWQVPVLLTTTSIMAAVTVGVRWYSTRSNKMSTSSIRNEEDGEGEGAWWPLIAAMVISCGTGVVLESNVTKYEGFALLGVTMTGICSSIGSIYASRLSSRLSAERYLRLHPDISPYEIQQEMNSRLNNVGSGVTLFISAWPVYAVFVAFVTATGWTSLPAGLLLWFTIIYALTGLLSIGAAHWITMITWNHGLDPDSYCLPIHSAIIDLIGQLLLVAAYELTILGGTTHVKT